MKRNKFGPNTLDYSPAEHPEIRAKIMARMRQGEVNAYVKAAKLVASTKLMLLSTGSAKAYYHGAITQKG